MSRRKNKTTAELQAAADHVDQEIAKLLAEKKDIRKQISETARRERNARLYFRGGELPCWQPLCCGGGANSFPLFFQTQAAPPCPTACCVPCWV